MLAILSLLVVVVLSILVTRVATIALTHTGLSREAARSQARSAFTGAGFTTSESERVLSHPVRRRIVMLLMLLGNAGFVTAVSTLILTFVSPGGGALGVKVVALVAGVRRPDDTWLGAPKGDTSVDAGDTLLLYGRVEAIAALDERRRGERGDRAHEEAVAEHAAERRSERAGDPGPGARGRG